MPWVIAYQINIAYQKKKKKNKPIEYKRDEYKPIDQQNNVAKIRN